MKFYHAQEPWGQSIGVFMTFKEAKEAVLFPNGQGRGQVRRYDVPFTADSMRRLIAGDGGYAIAIDTIWSNCEEYR
jgi:hypothetical protein